MHKFTARFGSPEGTRRRLLDAAARVFARSGLEGATTREIAREADVNEVTLFRHFHSKDKLLGEVVRQTFESQEKSLADGPVAPPVNAASGKPNLRAVLVSYAQRYHRVLADNLPLVRTLIGEIHRHQEHELRVLKGVFHPIKAETIATLERARACGTIRPEVDPQLAGDIFGSMILTEVLRRASPDAPKYSTGTYLESCVEIFARGVEV